MTIRVVGKAQAARALCPECLLILEYEPKDRRWIGGRNNPPQGRMYVVRVPYAVIDCPSCKHEIKL